MTALRVVVDPVDPVELEADGADVNPAAVSRMNATVAVRARVGAA